MNKQLQKDFPILQRKIHGRRLVYLDNAATTHKPKSVLKAMQEFYTHSNANIHRGVHVLAEEATQQYESAREHVAQFIHADPQEVVFTSGTTHSMNLVAYSALPLLPKGSEVVVTEMEHHSNFVPWQTLCKQLGLTFKIARVHDDGTLDMEDLGKMITKKTRLVAVAHVSNVTGVINDIPAIRTLAMKAGAWLAVDGAQAAPHLHLDMQRMGADFYGFSGHKMLGPTGIGVLHGRKELLEKMQPFHMGGGMIKTVQKEKSTWNELPWKFEAGTPNIAGVIGLNAALEYLEKIGSAELHAHGQHLSKITANRLAAIKGITVYGSGKGLPVFSFNVSDIHTHDVASYLDQLGIAVRGGNHCAAPLMQRFNINGTVRASFYIYNDEKDAEYLAEGIEKARDFFNGR